MTPLFAALITICAGLGPCLEVETGPVFRSARQCELVSAIIVGIEHVRLGVHPLASLPHTWICETASGTPVAGAGRGATRAMQGWPVGDYGPGYAKP